jgi:integrase
MRALRQREGLAQRALAFTILTAVRTGEAIGAKWSEFDLDNRTWLSPRSHEDGSATRGRLVWSRGRYPRGNEKEARRGIHFRRRQAGSAAVEHGDAKSDPRHGFWPRHPPGFRSTFKDTAATSSGKQSAPTGCRRQSWRMRAATRS